MSSSLLTEIQQPQYKALTDVYRILTPQYAWNDRFRLEKERLKTFENWSLEWLDKNILAISGMFYTGTSDHTKCYFCEVIIGKWDHGDDPVQEHLRLSPNCPLLQRRTTNNIPLNDKSLDAVLPLVKYATYDTPPTETRKPFHDYSIKGMRLQSYADWPKSMKQKPKDLAEAGFYYKGSGDSVVCFSCLGGLKDWEEDDEPWEQHALWMGHCCPYVKLMKGEEYIKSVHNKFKNYRPKVVEEESEYNQNMYPISVTSSESEENNLCKICFEKEYNTVCIPCGHVVACPECALSFKVCPVCRATVSKVLRLYFS